MSLIFRLSCRNANVINRTFLKRYKCPKVVSIMHAVTSSVKQEISEESHDAKNKRLCRPMSPHLTIYKYQLTSFMSLNQRLTGLFLTLFVIGLSVFAVFSPVSMEDFLDDLECMELGSMLVMLLKALLILPMAFHFWNGIRYVIWTSARMLGVGAVFNSGLLVLLLVAATVAGALADSFLN